MLASNPLAGAVYCGGEPVEGLRKFEGDVWPAHFDGTQPRQERVGNILVNGCRNLCNFNPSCLQGARSPSCFLVWIAMQEKDPRNPSINKRLRARTGAPGVVTRFKGDHRSAIARSLPSFVESHYFRVRTSCRLGGTSTNQFALSI